MASITETFRRLNLMDEGMDIYDDTYDVDGVCWMVPEKPDKRYQYEDMVTMLLASSIKVVDIHIGQYPYMTADIAGFVSNHYDVFREFTQDCRMVMDGQDRDNDLEVGISTVNGLVVGYFDEDAYKRFLELMGALPKGSKNRRRR